MIGSEISGPSFAVMKPFYGTIPHPFPPVLKVQQTILITQVSFLSLSCTPPISNMCKRTSVYYKSCGHMNSKLEKCSPYDDFSAYACIFFYPEHLDHRGFCLKCRLRDSRFNLPEDRVISSPTEHSLLQPPKPRYIIPKGATIYAFHTRDSNGTAKPIPGTPLYYYRGSRLVECEKTSNDYTTNSFPDPNDYVVKSSPSIRWCSVSCDVPQRSPSIRLPYDPIRDTLPAIVSPTSGHHLQRSRSSCMAFSEQYGQRTMTEQHHSNRLLTHNALEKHQSQFPPPSWKLSTEHYIQDIQARIAFGDRLVGDMVARSQNLERKRNRQSSVATSNRPRKIRKTRNDTLTTPEKREATPKRITRSQSKSLKYIGSPMSTPTRTKSKRQSPPPLSSSSSSLPSLPDSAYSPSDEDMSDISKSLSLPTDTLSDDYDATDEDE